MDSKKIGAFITEQRKKKGLNQRQLAERLNVTDKAVSRWETGKGMPETSLLKPLAEELGVSVSELLSGELHEAERMADEADRIIVSTLKTSKIKSRVTVILSIIIALLIVTSGVVLHLQSQEMISNLKTVSYDVHDETGGFIGVTFTFDKSSKVDGYEFMSYFNASTGTEIIDDYKAFPADNTSYYFGTQDGPSKLRIRAYHEQPNGEKLYTAWITVLDMNDENSIDFDNIDTINGDEWQKLIKDSAEFDPYNYQTK